MAENSKPAGKKRGRKVAPPGAKLSQLTIRIPPTLRLGLAMLARDRGMSISQAVEFALAQAMREYPLDESTIQEQIYRWGPRAALARDSMLSAEIIAEEALQSESLFVLVLPSSLRTSEEAFFIQVMEELGLVYMPPEIRRPGPGVVDIKHRVRFTIDSADADELLQVCRTAFRRGVDLSDAVEHSKELLAERKK